MFILVDKDSDGFVKILDTEDMVVEKHTVRAVQNLVNSRGVYVAGFLYDASADFLMLDFNVSRSELKRFGLTLEQFRG